jgi:hypothetical protein
MVARILFLLVLLLPLPASAQRAPSTLEGSWALQIGGATILRFDLEPVPGKAGEWRAAWVRPSSYASDGNRFSRLTLPAESVRSMAGLEFGETVEVSFPDPRPGAIPDIFRFRLVDPDAAEMVYVGTGLAPYLLERVAPGTALGPFREGATYARTLPRETEPDPEPAPEPVSDPAQGPEIEDAEPVLEVPEDPDDFRLPPSGVVGR